MSRVKLKKLLVQLRQLPDTSPAEALAEFRRLVATARAKVPKH